MPFSTPKGIAAFAAEFDCVLQKAHYFKHSMLLILGGKDIVICPDRAKEVFEKAGSKTKEIIELETGSHVMHKDLCKDELLTRLF